MNLSLGIIAVAQQLPIDTSIMGSMPEPLSRLLIVDDEAPIITLISTTLNPGYICEGATTALEAINCLDGDGPFDILLCDVHLEPGSKENGSAEEETTGLHVLSHARKYHPGTSVILMSGDYKPEVVVQALRARADDYLIKPFDLNQLYEAVARVMEMRRHPLRTEAEVREHEWNAAARALARALETRDNETSGHATRVVYFSLRLGQEMGLDRDQMTALKLGSRLHDVGKIGVSDNILRKPGKLTGDEFEKMKVHPIVGQSLVRNLDLPEGAARVVGQHHEKWDGSGYPLGLAGDDIDLPSRIFSVVDAFDAITSDRVYRKGKPYAHAVEEIKRHSGTQFDPRVVEAFLRIPEEAWDYLRKSCHLDDHHMAVL